MQGGFSTLFVGTQSPSPPSRAMRSKKSMLETKIGVIMSAAHRAHRSKVWSRDWSHSKLWVDQQFSLLVPVLLRFL